MANKTDKTKEWIIETAEKENVKFIRAQFVDVNGALKSTAIPANLLPKILDEGIGFDGSSVEGYTPIYESDMILMPDLSTFAIIPWRSSEDGKVARLICDVYWGNKKRFEGDPRYVAQRAAENAKKEGYIFNCGPELEFFLFNEGENGEYIPLDHGKYFDFHPLDLAEDFRRDVISAMTKNFEMEVEMSHHEVAPGQYEIDIKYDEMVRMADKVVTYKMIIKSIANAYGLIASFMPKPIFGENGSGMHTHQSLWDIKKNKNAFYD
ncbi:MAG: glutamine synthetase family protein, partial [Candidatus Altarchaeaceae archaeon]